MGIKDANNMGAAMAGAALDTLVTHFNDTGRKPSYYDAIFTGDLGYIGKDILTDLAKKKGFNIASNYDDCGVLIFDKEKQHRPKKKALANFPSKYSGAFYLQPIRSP